jgi:hypothetical protein
MQQIIEIYEDAATAASKYLTINLQFHSVTISVCLLRITVKITRCVQVMVRQRPRIKSGLTPVRYISADAGCVFTGRSSGHVTAMMP